MQSGFGSLNEEEFRVSLLWLTGATFDDICDDLDTDEDAVRKLWQQMRRKLRDGVNGKA